MKKYSLFLIISFLTFTFAKAQNNNLTGNLNAVLDNVMKAETMLRLKNFRNDFEKLISETANNTQLQEPQYSQLKQAFEETKVKYEEVIGLMKADLMDPTSSLNMQNNPNSYAEKYGNAYNRLLFHYQNQFMPVYNSINHSRFIPPALIELGIKGGMMLVDIIKTQIHNRKEKQLTLSLINQSFSSPLRMKNWDELVFYRPNTFSNNGMPNNNNSMPNNNNGMPNNNNTMSNGNNGMPNNNNTMSNGNNGMSNGNNGMSNSNNGMSNSNNGMSNSNNSMSNGNNGMSNGNNGMSNSNNSSSNGNNGMSNSNNSSSNGNNGMSNSNNSSSNSNNGMSNNNNSSSNSNNGMSNNNNSMSNGNNSMPNNNNGMGNKQITIPYPVMKELVGEISFHYINSANPNQKNTMNFVDPTRDLVIGQINSNDNSKAYLSTENYNEGTAFQIRTKHSALMYVFAFNSNQTCYNIYPFNAQWINNFNMSKNRELIMGPLMLQAEDGYTIIPSKNVETGVENYIQITGKAEQETLCILLSKSELNMEEVYTAIQSQTGSLGDRLGKVFGEQLLSNQEAKINLQNGSIYFESTNPNKNILPFVFAIKR